MTLAQAFDEVESAARAYANGANVDRLRRIHEAIAILKSSVEQLAREESNVTRSEMRTERMTRAADCQPAQGFLL
jgi:Na+-translocating ferredoxin:NAD+ oxidoreductase RnfC subunit